MTDISVPLRHVRCPQCGGDALYAPENPYRPFCSQRCKLHDLGDWANERFKFDVQERDGGDSADGLGDLNGRG